MAEVPQAKPARGWSWLLVIPFAVVAGLTIFRGKSSKGLTDDAVVVSDTVPKSPLQDSDMGALAAGVSSVWAGRPVAAEAWPARLVEPTRGVYVAMRHDGKRVYHGWRTQGTGSEALAGVLSDARKDLDDPSIVDTIEIDLTHTYRTIGRDDRDELEAPVHLGARGFMVQWRDRTSRFSPTMMVASNRPVAKQIEVVRGEFGTDAAGFAEAKFETFEADQVLVSLQPEPKATLMERGNRYVSATEVDRTSTQGLADGMVKWLTNAVHPDGRMTYKYWPSSGEESDGNNMIRQWMATVALEKVAADRNDPALWDLAEKNIRYNLEHYYALEGEHGVIIEGTKPGKVKLGALALAGYALWIHPKRETWTGEIAAIRRTIDSLQQDDGGFETWYRKGSDSEPQHNFYPGEALFFWAQIYETEPDPALLERFMRSFEYYRRWHLEEANRNPAFVPWHTQADYQVWKITRDDRLRDFIFEINDWLLSLQQWEGVPYREFKGSFHDPKRPQFGPPHASATGVYLEGLIDAYRLAVDVGDDVRRERYRVAIARGIRSLMQLQFTDDIDMFYVTNRKPVEGGLRTTEYNNEIRCDNVQHGLMGILKTLRTFEDGEFSIEE